MPYLEWNNAFSIGVPFFDDEHKDLIAIANELGAAIASGAELVRVRQIEARLFEHVAVHFRHEETFFEGYAFAEEHAEQHALLLQRVATYQMIAAADPSVEMCAQMLEFLADALVRHIAGPDKTLGAHIRACGVPLPAGAMIATSKPIAAP